MARLGINPARGKVTSYRPARVTVAILVYIPHLEGYFQHKLEILKVALQSAARHTTPPYDLLVFDNGSCAAVVDYLRAQLDAGLIHYLLLSSQNIGKIGALKIIFNAAPGEIVAYSDDDILYCPGWLEAHLALLEGFPSAGTVSGAPVRNAARHAMQSLDKLAAQPPPGLTIRRERRIPNEWEADWALSTGRDPQEHLDATRQDVDSVLHFGALEAIGGADHFQFACFKQVILQALPNEWSGKLMGHMIELDEALDGLGLLRLSTPQRYTRHLGNSLSPAVAQELRALGFSLEGEAATPQRRKKHWSLYLPGSRRVLRGIYNRLFNILHQLD